MAGKIILLDSCVVIELQRGNPEVIDKVHEYEQDKVFVTPIVIAEFYRGARDKDELAKCRKLISKFSILTLNEEVINTFSDFFDQYSLSHRPSIPDMLIAAAAIHYGIPIYTINKKDFRFIPKLELL